MVTTNRITPAASPLFDGCAASEIRAVSRLGCQLRVDAGRNLTVQGAAGREFFLVVAGDASCRVDGEEVARFGPGDFFGEMALVDGGERTATVRTVTSMTLVVYSRAEFRELVRVSSRVRNRLLTGLSQRLRAANAA